MAFEFEAAPWNFFWRISTAAHFFGGFLPSPAPFWWRRRTDLALYTSFVWTKLCEEGDTTPPWCVWHAHNAGWCTNTREQGRPVRRQDGVAHYSCRSFYYMYTGSEINPSLLWKKYQGFGLKPSPKNSRTSPWISPVLKYLRSHIKFGL